MPVSLLPEELRQAAEVPRVFPPVGPEVVQPGRVRPTGGEERGPARSTHGLLGVRIAEQFSTKYYERL